MITQEVNEMALATAAEFVVGREAVDRIRTLYAAIDQAMLYGYELGKHDAEQDVEERLDEAFDNGYDHGHPQGRLEGYEEGYVDGVGDARARPAIADERVGIIVSALDQHAMNSVDIDDIEAFEDFYYDGDEA